MFEFETIVTSFKNFLADIMGPTFPIINVLLIVVVGILGTMLFGRLKVRFQEILVQAVGLAALLIGCWGALDGFLVLQDGQIEATGTLLVLFSLLVGCLFGEALNVEKGLDKLSGWFQRLTENGKKKENTSTGKASASTAQSASKATDKQPVYRMPSARSGRLFEDGFAIAALICMLAGLAVSNDIVNRTTDGSVTLLIKTLTDAVIIFTLAMVYGSGPIFAAIPVLIVEGLLMILSVVAGGFLTATLINQLTLIASILLIVVGVNLCFGKKLRVANMLPALLIPALYDGIILLVNRFIGD